MEGRVIKRCVRTVVISVLSVAVFPTGAQAAGLDVVGKTDLGGAGLNGEVAVLGNTAIVGSGILGGSGVRSSFKSTYPCPTTTVKVVDLTTPSSPAVASQIPVPAGAVASDVALLHVNTPSFTGDLAAIAMVRCNGAGNYVDRGVRYWNVNDRANPQFLGRYQSDANQSRPTDPPCTGLPSNPPNPRDGFACAASNDQVALVQRPSDGKVLSLSTEPFASNGQGTSPPTSETFHGDLRVVDVTNPASPVEVASYPNGPDRFPGFGATPSNPRYGQSNNGCRPFDSGYGPAATPDGTKGLLSYFDQGLVTLDLANPAAPAKLGQWSYDRNDRALEGNAAYVNYARVGGSDLALMGETDWIAPNTSLMIDAPSSIAGSKFACEATFTLFDPNDQAQIYRKPASKVPGPIVYVGRGCPQDTLLADPNGKIAFRDAAALQAADGPRQTGLAGTCTTLAASQNLQNLGAKGVIVGSVQNAAGTARVQTFLGEGDQPALAPALTTPTIGMDIPDAVALRNALCPVPTTPPGCGPGGETMTGAMVDSKGDWGGLRVVDVSNPAAPTLRGTYHSPTAQVFPPPDRGIYSVHHAVASGALGYVAAHADGVRVINLADPALPELASFVPPDTPDPTSSIPPKAHVTGVDAGPGGTIVISDTNSGLYVLKPTPPPGGGGGGPTSSGLTAGGNSGTATADLLAPGVSSFGLTNNPFTVGGSTPTFGTAAAKKGKRHRKGTTLRYTLSEAGTVRITISQRLGGRRKGKRCVAPTRSLRKAKKCTRVLNRGTLTRNSHVGANSVAFSGRIGTRALSPGSYLATLIATDAAKNNSTPKTISFIIVKR